ncbi:hypothetical protein Mapa_013656 [Marchantia paleacea]|nr:hypothetical protein Mapa_013656 [Marchantia paleacea]
MDPPGTLGNIYPTPLDEVNNSKEKNKLRDGGRRQHRGQTNVCPKMGAPSPSPLELTTWIHCSSDGAYMLARWLGSISSACRDIRQRSMFFIICTPFTESCEEDPRSYSPPPSRALVVGQSSFTIQQIWSSLLEYSPHPAQSSIPSVPPYANSICNLSTFTYPCVCPFQRYKPRERDGILFIPLSGILLLGL